ncbi:MAG: DUF2161 family putative PD-(D/E)XK-type phosphodiesterase, partial [Pseudomonadales bacterium]|nr:DUF2161 family putative PD-(D/E)XK-type phosphodiesterase [Pseudomonadales bacterium]
MRRSRCRERIRIVMAEADLYAPVKRFLEAQGYTVKGEIGACDVVAVRGDAPPVVVELKARPSLELVLQGVDRLAFSDQVYVAFAAPARGSKGAAARRRRLHGLLRRLGLGLLLVREDGTVLPELDPGPYRPRPNARKRARLLKEFAERAGDPEPGGAPAGPRLTAYRQDAIRCAEALSGEPVLKASIVRDRSGVPRAATILRDNHYGWFERVARGHYALTQRGREDLGAWSQALARLLDAHR